MGSNALVGADGAAFGASFFYGCCSVGCSLATGVSTGAVTVTSCLALGCFVESAGVGDSIAPAI